MAYPKQTLYDILGVSRDANDIDIGLAYQRRKAAAERASPPDPQLATLLHEAHEVLHDPSRRAAYDASLVTAEARTAAAAQETPDLVLEGGEETLPARKPPWAAIIGVLLVLVIGLAIALKMAKPSAGKVESAVVVEPKPEPPAPAQPRSAADVLADATASGGQVMSYSMSGQAIPIGLATSTEEGTMITTCHGLPAGAKLVVRVKGQPTPADMVLTDEQLDLCKLQVAGFRTPPVKIATEAAKAGDRIYVVGANAAGEFAMTEGTVKSVLSTADGPLLELSMPVAPFGSGGGVFDAYGKLVGIATVQHRSGLSIAYPASSIAKMRTRGAVGT